MAGSPFASGFSFRASSVLTLHHGRVRRLFGRPAPLPAPVRKQAKKRRKAA